MLLDGIYGRTGRSGDRRPHGVPLHNDGQSGGRRVRSDCRIILNDEAAARLRDADLHHGLDLFRSALPERIRVPASIEARPEPGKLRIGLEAHGWPKALIA